MDLVSVFWRQITTFSSKICWRCCLFSIAYFWHLCQERGECSCMDSYPGPLLCSPGLNICFCASTMHKTLILVWFYSILWIWVLRYLQLCFFSLVLAWLFLFFCLFVCFQMNLWEKTHISKIWNEKGEITTNTKEIQKIIKGYSEDLCSNKLEVFKKWTSF
jgi:hypothetical protein